MFDSLTGDNNAPTKLGADFTYWQQIYRFTRLIIINKQFLPGLVKEPYAYRPVWEPYLPALAGELHRLAQAMPKAACHLVHYQYRFPSYVRPNKRDLLLSFINAILNALIAQALSDYQGLPLPGDSPAEIWLNRLIYSPDTGLPLPATQANTLYLGFTHWQTSITAGPESLQSFRTCFRLEAPPVTDEVWKLSFFIHPTDDPSLMLTPDLIWSTEGDTFAYLDRHLPNLQQKLLRDLDHAARFYPPLLAVLAEPCPTARCLTTEQAHAFLVEAADILKRAGFGVIVPNWWRQDQPGLSVRLEIEDQPAGRSFLGLHSLAAYSMEAAIGDAGISRDELEAIAALKAPLVRIAGHWREISPQQAKELVALFHRHGHTSEISFSSLLKLTATGDLKEFDEQLSTPTPVTTITLPDRLTDLFHRLMTGQTLPEIAVPPGFRGTLRPYQLRGLAWLSFLDSLGLGACLADDMGLGKTIQLIAFLLHKKGQRPRQPPSLIVCPMSVANNWRRELAKFAPELKVLLHHGPDRLSGSRFSESADQQDIVLTTYALVYRDNSTLAAVTWAHVILDEAQNIKNPSAQQTAAIMQLPARCRIALTGTPLENRLTELWSNYPFYKSWLPGQTEAIQTALFHCYRT
ncbi:DEAD/DEAH box helicase [Sporomusa sp.]|uniref:DEAD/DEAH box helicase n=1 Tax=Sporomusa sp. TaxID=2078658 RepID=UPI002CC8A716|nr:DEAD/DEAH box helicase [Sporomusa sp.]HWR45810.1 DEAD/DEAH box helicase [Sporomusa sp.]